MRQDVVMPPLGEDAGNECTVSFWQCEVGDRINEDDPLAEMTTDKAIFEVPSPFAGKLVQIVAGENAVVKVGDKIAVIETDE